MFLNAGLEGIKISGKNLKAIITLKVWLHLRIFLFFHCINLCLIFFQNDSVRVCEHCLKITRAPTAYEECCTDKDNAFSWCQRIYNFSQSKGRR